MKNYNKSLFAFVAGFMTIFAVAFYMPTQAFAQNDSSRLEGRSEAEIKIIKEICNDLPRGLAKRIGLCRAALNIMIVAPTPAPSPAPSSDVADTTAPTVSGIGVWTIRTYMAEVMWQTNDWTNGGKVYVSTTSGFSIADTANVKTYDEVSKDTHTGHRAIVDGLTPGTTYYFVIKATDVAGNSSMSVEKSFKTTGTSPVHTDTTAPVITALAVNTGGELARGMATISWKTNENADSKIMWSKDVTFAEANVKTQSSTTMQNFHSLTISGLEANSIYYFKVMSKDASGNIGTSIVGSIFQTR